MTEDFDGTSALLYPVRVRDKLVAKEYRNAPRTFAASIAKR
jgi:hypothetical protein